MNDDLEQLKRNPATLRLYQERVRLRRDGRELVGCCPFHSERTPSFKISLHDGAYIYKCFGCQKSGNIIQFVSDFDKVPFNAAADKVRQFLGAAPKTEFRPRQWDGMKQSVEQVFQPLGEERALKTYSLAEYAKFEHHLATSHEARQWLEQARGISYETARRLRFGFRQDVGKLAGQDNQDIAGQGWIALPCLEDGRVVSIKYRSIARKAFCRQPGMKTTLFNLETVDPLEPLYVTEGEFDAAVLEQAGFHAVSLPSAIRNFSPEMKDQIMQADTVVLAGDCDGGVGNEVMEKLWAELEERTYLLHWPADSKDANDALRKHCAGDREKFQAVVRQLTREARKTPMPGVESLQEAMLASNRVNLADHPQRLRLPWPSADRMAILLPGSVASISATNTKMGKALKNGTRVLSPSGWIPIEKLEVGDLVIGADGKPTEVRGVFPQGIRPLYDIRFSDGTITTCDEDHLWTVYDKNTPAPRTLTTRELRNTKLRWKGNGPRWFVPRNAPVAFSKGALPVDPYLLGSLLGDGSFVNTSVRFTTADTEMAQRLSELLPSGVCLRRCEQKYDYALVGEKPRNPLRAALRELGLLGKRSEHKFVPRQYLFNDPAARLSVLQGLMDTDGFVDPKSRSMEFTSTSQQLANDVVFLVRSLGGVASIRNRRTSCLYRGQRRWCENYRVRLWLPVAPFRLERKRAITDGRHKVREKSILSIDRAGHGEATCIRVAAKDGLFIAENFTVTHNTAWVMNATLHGARLHGEVVLNYQCELDSAEFSTLVAAHVLRKSRNNLTKADFEEAAKKLGKTRYYIGRNPTLTTVTPVLELIEAAIKRLGPTVVVLDHLHFICRNEDNEIQAQANAMQRIKNMAVKYRVKFIVVGQPRKANQQSKGKVIHVTDFKGSESVTSDADAIFVLHRDYIRNKDPLNPPKDDYEPKTELHLLGARSKGDGPTFCELFFVGEFASFNELTIEPPPPPTGQQQLSA